MVYQPKPIKAQQAAPLFIILNFVLFYVEIGHFWFIIVTQGVHWDANSKTKTA
jgi:hypothetical protein